jgi:hypothetical protein
MLVAMDGGEQAYTDVLAAVFGSPIPHRHGGLHNPDNRLKPVTNSQVKGFQAGYQEEEFLERRNTPQDLH